MSLPKEPRQLMINLMYLVLTAMLALNVSSEILNAFKTINDSITSSNSSIQDKNQQMYELLDELEDDPVQHDRVKEFNDKAKIVKSKSQEVIEYLENWKDRIIAASGGYEINDMGKKDIRGQRDIDASTRLLVEHKGGDTVKQKLSDLRNFLLSQVNPANPKAFADQIPLKITEVEKTDNNPQADWKVSYFYNMPTVAIVAMMSKFQNDVRNSEAMIVNELVSKAGQADFEFDAIKAIAVTDNSYALAGQTVKAQILMAAYNKAANPTVSASSGRVTGVENGVASWETVASGVGLQTVRGTVSIDMGSGKKATEPFEFEYMVGSTGASIQLDKMNVFYIGVPNPITVSAAGYSIEDISVSIPGAELKSTGKGKYDVTVKKPGLTTAKILASTANGVKEVGAMEIRVKSIPDPKAKIAGVSSGMVAASVFRAQAGIVADLENFEFDARFVVTSYEMSWIPKSTGEYMVGGTVNSPYFKKSGNANIAQYMDNARIGDKVFFDNIKARGPDGRTRDLGSIVLTLR